MTFHVDSEVGQLQQVIVHRPGLELARLTPDNVDDLLFDDVMWAAPRPRGARRVRRASSQRQGVVVHRFADLLAEALDEPGAREFVAGPADHRDPVRAGARRAARRPRGLDAGTAAGRPADRRRPQVGRGRPAPRAQPADGLPARRRLPAARRCRTTCSSATTPPGSTTASRSTRWPSRRASGRRSTPAWSTTSTRCSATPASRSSTATTRSAHEPATIEGGDITVIGNRRRDDRHGRALHAAGRRDPGPRAVRARLGRPGHRGRAAARARVHAPRHGDDDDRPRRLQRLPLPARRAALLHPRPPRTPAATSPSRRTATCSPPSPRRSASTRSGCCGRRSTRWAPSASSGTTATTSWPSRPGVILGYERNTTTNRYLRRRGHRDHPRRRAPSSAAAAADRAA